MLLSQLSRVALGEVSREPVLSCLLDFRGFITFSVFMLVRISGTGGLDVIQQVSLILA